MKFFNSLNPNLLLALGIAAVVAVMTAFWLWSQEPKYRVLFSNFSDKDGGAIVAALEQMNIPYKIMDSGAAIMVPGEQVHQVRLKLASMGLPKGGNVGFELMEKQGFGVSQFVEQVNYQRALVGELERSIQAISVVENARVHLAIPKSTVFVRDQQKPSASVLVKLQAGRTLEPQQVSAILHLMASSVAGLTTANVSIVDQNGNLLSDTTKKPNSNQLDASQIKYIEEMQKSIAMRVESIITPLVGVKNVHAQASVEIDFASQEQAEEIYKPNKNPDVAVVRSQQINESASAAGANASGIPGAITNQPGQNATAPLNTDPNATVGGVAPNAAGASPSSKNTTVNYEVDKTVRYTQKSTGGIKRISVAVVVNEKQELDKTNKIVFRPLNEDEKKQINELAKQAMGFNEARGDSLSVVNTPFAPVVTEELAEIPIWKNTEYIEAVKSGGKLLLGILGLFFLYQRALKPMVTKLLAAANRPDVLEREEYPLAATGPTDVRVPAPIPETKYAQNLIQAKQLAKQNPKAIASVVTSWVNNPNEG
ncbi:MAG: flagellar basal-body MS-ring/collar protein FliF [Alcaligenaceae bacterium]